MNFLFLDHVVAGNFVPFPLFSGFLFGDLPLEFPLVLVYLVLLDSLLVDILDSDSSRLFRSRGNNVTVLVPHRSPASSLAKL